MWVKRLKDTHSHDKSKAFESAFSPKLKSNFLFASLFFFLILFHFFSPLLFIMTAVTKETLPPIGHATAGSAGAMFASALVYPLDM